MSAAAVPVSRLFTERRQRREACGDEHLSRFAPVENIRRARAIFFPKDELVRQRRRIFCRKNRAVPMMLDQILRAYAIADEARHAAIKRLRNDEPEAFLER